MKFIAPAIIVTLALTGSAEASRIKGKAGEEVKEGRTKRGLGKGSPPEGECFQNAGFELLSKAILTPPLPYQNAGINRRLDTDEDHRRLGCSERCPCMDIGGFPIYYQGGG